MVDRIEFSPLGGVDPRQLFAQRDARAALLNSLAAAAPQVGAPAPGARPAPEAPQPAERPEREEEQRPPREEAVQQNLPGAPGVEENPAPAVGGAEEAPGPAPADLALEARLAGEAFQISVPGTDLARAQGAPLFGGLTPGGPENPAGRDIAPLGEGGRREQNVPGPRPLGGGPADVPAALGPQGPAAPGRAEPAAPAPAPQNAAPAQEGNEPRGSVVNVLV